jgi:hypothetical protein
MTVSLAVSLLLLSTAPEGPPGAAPAPLTRPTQASDAVPGGLDPNETICRRFRESGSRIAIRRTCMTREQWAAFTRELRQNVDRAQLTRNIGGK